MDISNFKNLETKNSKAGLKGSFNSAQLKRTLIFMLIGAAVSFAWYYYTDGQHVETLATADIFKALTIGSLFGIFISNSPCARGKC